MFLYTNVIDVMTRLVFKRNMNRRYKNQDESYWFGFKWV